MSGEEVVGIFLGGMNPSAGLLKYKDYCTLIFTTTRLIVDTSYCRRPALGTMGRPIYLAFKVGVRDRMKMKEMSIEDALRSDPKNLEIKYDDIKVVEIKVPLGAGLVSSALDFLVYMDSLDTPTHKFGVAISVKYHLDDFRKLVETVLPGKV